MIIAPPTSIADVPRWKEEFIAIYEELGYGEVTEEQLPNDEYFEEMFAESDGKETKSYTKDGANCGTGAGGFQAGNDCASGEGAADKPKGAPGEDKEKQKEQVKTPEFKEWFGDSKVVGEDGKPMVVYHQTNAEFDTFERERAAQGVFWFTSTEEKARGGTGLGPATSPPKEGTGASRRAGDPWIVKEVYLSAQKLAGWDEYEKLGLGQIQGRGFDGVKLDDDYIVFDSNQIKSATGNDGAFDSDSDNINKAADNCGTGAGGFQSGNDCAGGDGSSSSDKPKKTPEDKDGMPLVDMNDNPVRLNDDGTITLYHGTTKENAKLIRETGRFISRENTREAFFSTVKEGTEGYGDGTVVEVHVDPSIVRIDDAFRGKEEAYISVAASIRDIPEDAVVDDSQTTKAADCGTGAGGFKPGNDCASGDGASPSAPKKVNDLARRIREDGGFTYNPISDSSPTEGFAVSPFKELELVIDTQAPEGMDLAKYRKNMRPKLKKYIKDNIETLRRKGAHLGGWWDKEAKKVYLDISIVNKNLKDAMRIAKEHDQEAIFDLATMETISAR